MNLFVLGLLNFYSSLLLLYPRRFRDEFAEEMQVVFRDSVNEAVDEGVLSLILVCLRELSGLPFNILREFWHEFERKERNMVTDKNPDSKSTARNQTNYRDATLGMLPFALFGIASMIGKLGIPFLGVYADLAFYVIVLVGLLIGLGKDVPRWAYSYLGWSLLFAWWWTNMYTTGLKIFGHTMFNEAWGWRIWYPLFITIGIALLWTRSLRPLRQLVHGIWQDWTLLSLGLYTFGGFVLLIFDENHHPYLFSFMFATTLVIVGSIWFYMKSANTGKQVIALLSGFVVSYIIVRICDATWDWAAYHGFPPSPPEPWYMEIIRTIAITAFWSAITFWPAIIGLVQHIVNNRQKPGMAA